MFRVCTYCGNYPIEIASFDTKAEAEIYMSQPAVMAYADEFCCGEEDYIVYPEEMWIEEEQDEIPFFDPADKIWPQEILDELPL